MNIATAQAGMHFQLSILTPDTLLMWINLTPLRTNSSITGSISLFSELVQPSLPFQAFCKDPHPETAPLSVSVQELPEDQQPHLGCHPSPAVLRGGRGGNQELLQEAELHAEAEEAAGVSTRHSACKTSWAGGWLKQLLLKQTWSQDLYYTPLLSNYQLFPP